MIRYINITNSTNIEILLSTTFGSIVVHQLANSVIIFHMLMPDVYNSIMCDFIYCVCTLCYITKIEILSHALISPNRNKFIGSFAFNMLSIIKYSST